MSINKPRYWHSRENWYRDVWLVVVTAIVLLSLTAQARDRKNFEHAVADARYGDCLSSNETRAALRRKVERGKLERPFLLKVIPQFNTPQIISLIEKNEREELHGFRPRECIEYAEEALPGHHKRYTLRISR